MKIIAFLGPDGSGKSTIIREIRKMVGDTAVEVRHFRITLRPADRPPVVRPYAKPPHSYPLALCKLLLWHGIQFAWGCWRMAAGSSASLVLFDRFLYDVAADPRRYRVPEAVARLPWPALVWPRPALVVVLTPPREVTQARKAEVTPEEGDAQLARYERLLFNGDAVFHADGTEPPDVLARAILDAVGGP